MLEVAELCMNYGGVQALSDVSMKFLPGRITGVIGPNGAGKTSLFDVITGFARPRSGRVTLGGERIDGQRPSRNARRGLARTFQEVRTFDGLTVGENVFVGMRARGYRNVVRDGWRRRREDDESLEGRFPQLGSLASRMSDYPGDLSFGERKRLEYVRLLALGPEALLLDEPASGLDRSEQAELTAIMRSAATAGAIVCVIEHNMDFVLDVCDYVFALHLGRVLSEGTPEDVLANEEVQRVYLGQEAVQGGGRRAGKG